MTVSDVELDRVLNALTTTFNDQHPPALDVGRVEEIATASTADGAANAVDDDATTRWTTQAAQTPGQWLQVDLGSTQSIRRVVLDTGADRGDYPRGYTLETSTDGSTWTTRASGAGSGQLTTIDIPATSARYVLVTQTGSSGSWWSVADVRAYG